jgi:hypothetical protein
MSTVAYIELLSQTHNTSTAQPPKLPAIYSYTQ